MSDTISQLFENQLHKALEYRYENLEKRKERLRILKKWIFDHKDKIRKAVHDDLGKPERDVDISEIFPVTSEINQALKHLNKWFKPKRVKSGLLYLGTKAKIKMEPKGRCLIIAPWNYPFQLVASPLVSCIAAGNTAIIKPSEHTPATSAILDQMVTEVFKPDTVTVIQGAIKETQELLSLPFDHIFFTGSTTVGKIVMKAAAKHLTSVTLELGGKSPVIIDDTAQTDDAAEKIVWGKFTNNGQTCVAPDYIFVHQSKMDEFIRQAKKHIKRLFDPSNRGLKKSPFYSRIVHQRHMSGLISMMDEAIGMGAQLLIGGTYDMSQRFIEPTLIQNVHEKSDLWQEEIFGPILPIKTFNDIEQVIKHINSRDKPLALYLFSKNKHNHRLITNQTSAGSMVINDVVIQYAHPHLPFGGVNHSGIGKSHGKYGFMEFSNQKSVLKQRIGLTNVKIFYPPFTQLTKKLVSLVIKYF